MVSDSLMMFFRAAAHPIKECEIIPVSTVCATYIDCLE